MSIPTVLAIPSPAPGHINPMMSLSHKLVEHGFKVIFVNTDFSQKRMVNLIDEEVTQHDSPITFVSIPDGLEPEDDRTDLGKLGISFLSTMPGALEKLIEDIHLNGDYKICCIVADANMGWAIQVANKLGIKGAVFSPASAAMFALSENIPMLIDKGIIDSEGTTVIKTTIQLSPDMLPMDTRFFWWSNIYDSDTQKIIFNYFRQVMQYFSLTEWWLCNTTYELEPGALSLVPKLLPIGPLLGSATARTLGQFWEEDLSCMSWLDQQPHRSVLYVAFGSYALFDQNQFSELALGLELTNRPFLWVVRQDSNSRNKMTFPDEFQGSHGKIIRWAPQQKVLSHPAIACFVSHCGWNSTMDGLSKGVPFLCWPYFNDQFYDKTFICDQLKVGLGFDSTENGLVSRFEIKKKVDQLLSDENITSRALEVKEKLMSNIAEGGRSSENLKSFAKWLKE